MIFLARELRAESKNLNLHRASHLFLRTLEVLKSAELGVEKFLDVVANARSAVASVVVMERPELLESIERARLEIQHGELFEVPIHSRSESLL